MPSATVTIDTSAFERAVKFAFAESEKSLVEIINRGCLVAIVGGRGVKGAMARTPKASRSKILGVDVKKIARHVMFKHKGQKLTRKQISQLIGKEYRRRVAAIGYTARVGWNNAAVAFGGKGIGKRAAGKGEWSRGSGQPASFGNYVATFTNTTPVAALIGTQALQDALNDTAQDIVQHWEEKAGAIFQGA